MPFIRYAFCFRYRKIWLALAIIQNSKIEGIAVGSREIKITQYVDDTWFFWGTKNRWTYCWSFSREKFERCSGLKINPTKSEAIWLRKWKNREDTPFNFKWLKESVFVLEVHFSNCKRTCDKLNFYDKLDAWENTLNNWKRQTLTLLGKYKHCKTSRPLKTYFHCICSSSPCDQVNKITFIFIWDNKIAKIKRNTIIIGERENGGLHEHDWFFLNEQSLKMHLDKAL